ncbi:hypothetical protein VTK56DRAFT_7750 [Thermocarpiscus australiensis]
MIQRTLARFRPPKPANTNPADYVAGQFGSSATPTIITKKSLQEFIPNQKVLEFANKHGILFPPSLRLVPGQRFNKFPFRLSICEQHVFSVYHLKYLGLWEHALTEKTLYFYAQHKKQRPLWLYFHASAATDGSNAVVRHTSERACSAALLRALRSAGYDKFGRSLDGTKRELTGTVRIAITHPKEVLKLDFQHLVGYITRLVVYHVVPRLRAHGMPFW